MLAINSFGLSHQLKNTELAHSSEGILHYSPVQGEVSEDHLISLRISTGTQGLVDV